MQAMQDKLRSERSQLRPLARGMYICAGYLSYVRLFLSLKPDFKSWQQRCLFVHVYCSILLLSASRYISAADIVIYCRIMDPFVAICMLSIAICDFIAGWFSILGLLIV